MTKNEFLRRLESELKTLPVSVRNDILNEYENHIDEGMQLGESEAAIVDSLGNPADIADEVLSIEEAEGDKSFVTMQSNHIQDINPKEIDVVDIQGDFLSVDITSGPKFEMNYESYDGRSDFSHGVDGKTLYFRHKSRNAGKVHFNILGFLRSRDHRSDKLTIVWPEKLTGLQIRTEKGSVKLDGLSAEDFDITTELGSINSAGIFGVKGGFKSEMGSIAVKESAFNHLLASTDMGKVKLDDVDAELQELSTDMGAIDIKNAHPDANITAHTDMGSIVAVYKHKPTETRIIARTKMGSLANQLENYTVDDPKYTARFTTSMGSISIH